MKKTVMTHYKWAYLPVIFSSAAILATSVMAGPSASQHYQDAKQVSRANYEYVGGNTQIGVGITDDGDASVDLNHVFSETKGSSTSVGLWAGVDLRGENSGVKGRGIQVSHNWVSRNKGGRATHVNKVFGAYDRSESKHEKVTVGYGQEDEHLFWEGHVSKGLSDKKASSTAGVSNKAYDYGVGASAGKFIKESNVRLRAGLDYEWGDDVGVGEDTAKNTTLSAGVEKFFQDSPHSVGLDVSASKRSGGYSSGSDNTQVSSKLSYRYDFGGASIYQPDRRYKRTRVEVPGAPARYNQKTQFKRVQTYKSVPVYGKKTVRTPYKQLVKSTMELEGQTFFKLNSAKLIPSAKTRLREIATEIRKTGYKGSIRITGNTCGLGDPDYDQRLSEQRARAVRAFLIKNGFNPRDLIARGLGKNHPKFPNTPDQGFKNRRVDIEYISEQKKYKTAYRTEQKTVKTGTRRVATGFKNVPAGQKNVLIQGAGAPRVIWKTEAIASSPAWIKRALHNNIKHNTNVNTYQTTAGSTITNKPNANGDSVTLETCTDTVINVLDNDNLGSGGITVSITADPSHGSVEVLDDGSVRYTPDEDYVGEDSFTYMITDSNGNSSSAEVDLTVTEQCQGGNAAPTANDDSTSTGQGEVVAINPLDNDTDPDSDALTLHSVSDPENGETEIVDDQIIYRPDAGFTGTETFTYTISDGHGHRSTATITVTVGSTGDLPDANDDSVSMETCTSKVITVLANDNQGSGNASVAVTEAPSNGTTEVLADGSIRYTPVDDYVGDDAFTYTITDSNGNESSATVYITVTNQCSGNEAPVAMADTAETTVCEAITISVLDNDYDPDSDPITISSVSGMSYGTAIISNSGSTITYTPTNSCGAVTDHFSYTITDDHGNTASADITVEVTDPDPENIHWPVIINEEVTTMEGVAITIDVLSNDSDADGDTLVLDQVDDGSNGTTQKVGGQVVYTPNAGFTGTDEFWYGVHDGHGHSNSGKVTITVTD